MTSWIVFIILWSIWLLFMVLFQFQWEGIVVRLNRFLTEIGILSKKNAAKAIVFEKGLGLKILVLIGLLGGVTVVVLDVILERMTSS